MLIYPSTIESMESCNLLNGMWPGAKPLWGEGALPSLVWMNYLFCHLNI